MTVSQPTRWSPPPPRAGKPTRRHKPTHKPRLLLHGVRVRVEHGRLLVACRLNGPARVSAVAMRSTHVVGRAGWHIFHGRSCHLVIPYRGPRPPSKLKIFAVPYQFHHVSKAP